MCLLLVLIARGEIGPLHCGGDLATRVSPISLSSTFFLFRLKPHCGPHSSQASQVSSEHLNPPPPLTTSLHLLLLLPGSANHISLINS